MNSGTFAVPFGRTGLAAGLAVTPRSEVLLAFPFRFECHTASDAAALPASMNGFGRGPLPAASEAGTQERPAARIAQTDRSRPLVTYNGQPRSVIRCGKICELAGHFSRRMPLNFVLLFFTSMKRPLSLLRFVLCGRCRRRVCSQPLHPPCYGPLQA